MPEQTERPPVAREASHIDDDIVRRREFVRQVAQIAPVFTAAPGGNGSEFHRPLGWSAFDVGGNDVRLKGWQDGHALCAVMGDRVAVVDVDPRNGGDIDAVRNLLRELDVRMFAVVHTPGDGRHYYVSGHPDLPKCSSVTGYPGMDVLSRGGHVFLPGTCRPRYKGRGYRVIANNLDALIEHGDPEGAGRLAAWVTDRRATGNTEATAFTPSPPWHGGQHTEGQARFLQKVLDTQHAKVANTAPGGRNNALFEAAMNCGNYIAGAGMDEQKVTEVLIDASTINGYLADEGMGRVLGTIRSGFANGKQNPQAVPDLPEPPPVTVLGSTSSSEQEMHEEFWAARPALTHLHTFARARRAAPWAVLGVVLARVVVATPPHVVLPPLVGGDASLNLFVGIVGASGDGKGAASSAGADAVRVGHVHSHPVGSGEGLTHLFVQRVKGEVVQHTTAVLAEVGEVDTLTALNSRQGSTLQPVLRQAYMGEEFGFGYADPTKRLVVHPHQYRLSMLIGVQPKRADGLLNDADGGTPQRFLWLPAVDRGAPDTAPPVPKPLPWELPKVPRGDLSDGRVRLPVCDTARTAVDTARLARIREEQDALDGHALLTRLKVAAALGLLDGRYEASEEDWQLAATVMAVSDATRAHVVATLQHAKRSSNRARGEAEAERTLIVTERQEERAVKRVARNVHRNLSQPLTGAELRRRIASRDRHLLDDALDLLTAEGRVVVEAIAPDEQGGGGHGQRYARAGVKK